VCGQAALASHQQQKQADDHSCGNNTGNNQCSECHHPWSLSDIEFVRALLIAPPTAVVPDPPVTNLSPSAMALLPIDPDERSRVLSSLVPIPIPAPAKRYELSMKSSDLGFYQDNAPLCGHDTRMKCPILMLPWYYAYKSPESRMHPNWHSGTIYGRYDDHRNHGCGVHDYSLLIQINGTTCGH
jgi:hypothetical protein